MIRINLLAADRPQAGKKAAATPGAFQAYLLVGGLSGVAALVCAGMFFMMNGQIQKLDNDIAQAKQRQSQLQEVKKRVEELEKKRNTAKQKLGLIEDLRASQQSAVRMMDEISQSLPDLLWLTQANQTGGSVQFTGQASTLNAVAEFMTRLGQRGAGCDPKTPAGKTKCWFPEVNLVSSTASGRLVAFAVSAAFQNPEVAERAAKKAAEDKVTKAAADKAADKAADDKAAKDAAAKAAKAAEKK